MTTAHARAGAHRPTGLVDFRYLDEGVTTAGQFRAGTAPTVVVVPAMGQTSVDWGDALPSTRAAIWSFNRPSCGGADPRRHHEPMPYSAFAAELDATLEASPAVGPYVLVGHSLGGLIALAYTQRRPGMVAGIVLVDPSFPHMDLGGRGTEPKIDGDDATGNPIDVDTDAGLVATAVVPGVPAVVLSRAPGWPDYISADEDNRWHAWHSDLATRWGAPRLVAETAGHQMQRDAPSLVGYAIAQVVQCVRDGQRSVEVTIEDVAAREATIR